MDVPPNLTDMLAHFVDIILDEFLNVLQLRCIVDQHIELTLRL
jgi:hypothetical protein